jgi:hypothetical protein
MGKYTLSKDAAVALFLKETGWINLLIDHSYHVHRTNSGYVITVLDKDDIPVDRVLVRYDTKMFRNKECIYEGSYNG